ncbi:MAG: DUF2764 family protein, partial [Deltaproteobacteria bacterium]|nr:DUF2764 family protein [Deltaproteobacteria bacterium]
TCEIELSRSDMSVISSITLQPPAGFSNSPSFIESWYSGERQLRLELARLRAARLGRSNFVSQGSVSPFFKKIARQAMAFESPWQAEELLDLSRWQILNELETEHDSGLPRLAVYFLKLQLLERRALFNQQAGQKLRREIVNRITLFVRSDQ